MRLGFSLSPSFVQDQRMEQKVSLRQELKLSLRQELKLEPLDPNHFQEPEGHTDLKNGRNGPYFEVANTDLRAFAAAIKVASGVILRRAPNVVLVGMRGANPYAEAIKYSLNEDPEYSRFFLGLPGNTSKTEGMRKLPEFIGLQSTYFLKNLAGHLESSLVKAVPAAVANRGQDNMPLRFMLIDTSVTGTKLGWYLPAFVDACEKASTISKKQISLDVLVFRPAGRGGHIESDQLKGVSTRVHEIVIPHLITEDVPALLTGHNSKFRIKPDQVHPEAVGVIQALNPLPKAGVKVSGGSSSFYSFGPERDTFACFQAAFRDTYEEISGTASMPSSVTFFPGTLTVRDKCEAELLIPLRQLKVLQDKIGNTPEVNFLPNENPALTSLKGLIEEFIDQVSKQIARFSWESKEIYPAVAELKGSLEHLSSDLQNYLDLDLGHQSLTNLMKSTNPKNRFEEVVARALYRSSYSTFGAKAAKRRGAILEHQPHEPVAALATLLAPEVRAHYKIALIVGPEGFAYEPLIESMGMETIAVNIPEADPNGIRTIRKYKKEPLSRLSKKTYL